MPPDGYCYPSPPQPFSSSSWLSRSPLTRGERTGSPSPIRISMSKSCTCRPSYRPGLRLIHHASFFDHFEGRQGCGIASTDIYIPPVALHPTTRKHSLYCPNRAKLLEAMSGGGRHGFDTPYFPLGCHFRWFTTPEICMILDRFDSVIFLGDNTLRHIYSAFNMLLRENIALGGLKEWEMKESEREACRCDNQLSRPECLAYSILDSRAVRSNDASSGHSSPYLCDRRLFHLSSEDIFSFTAYRYTPRLHSRRPFTRCRGSTHHIQLLSASRTGFLQAHRRDTFTFTCHVPSLADSYIING